jgi:hypothetical protein
MAVRLGSDFADRLEVFFGDSSDVLCRVYARLRGPEAADCLRLTGRLMGPTCLYAKTLPVTFPLVDRGPGDSLVAEAIVPEPCFWTPEMPHVYQLDVQLQQGDQVLASAQRLLGIRTLGAQGKKMVYAGKRWVLCGVRVSELPPTPLCDWRACDAAMMIENPSDGLCLEASRVGVLIVATLASPEMREIRRLSRWPAVGIVALPSQTDLQLDDLKHNLLLAQLVAAGSPIIAHTWAQIALCEFDPGDDGDDFAGRLANYPLAVVATRPAGQLPSVADGRTLCDRLQRDLAGRGELAGYIV